MVESKLSDLMQQGGFLMRMVQCVHHPSTKVWEGIDFLIWTYPAVCKTMPARGEIDAVHERTAKLKQPSRKRGPFREDWYACRALCEFKAGHA